MAPQLMKSQLPRPVVAGSIGTWPRRLVMVTAFSAAIACGGKEDDGGATATSGATGDTGQADTSTSSSSSGSSGSSSTTGSSAGTTSTSSTSGGSATGTSSSSGDTGFVVPPDGGGVNMCDIYAQDCVSGQKCTSAVIAGMLANVCVPIDPNPQVTGDACTRDDTTGQDNCEKGALCLPDPDPELMRCFSLCTGAAAMPMCSDARDTCVLADSGFTPICFPTCDPLTQDCGIEGWACYPNVGSGEPFICAPDRTDTSTTGDAGSSCGAINGCHAGLVCVAGTSVAGCATGNCCAPFCDLSDPNASADCPGAADGEECITLFAMDPPPEYANVGICVLPA